MTRWEWSSRVLSPDGPKSPTVRLVLVALLTFVNETKGYAWPSAERIAERTGHCERTVRAALVEAETGGWLRRDAMPGHVTHYYPTVPEDRALRLAPANAAGVARQGVHEPRQPVPDTPAGSADDLRKEPSREPKKEGRGPAPACPDCSAPMREERSRRTKEPMFWGCTRFRTAGCRGRLEFGQEPDPERERQIAEERIATRKKQEAATKADNEAAIERNAKLAAELRARVAKTQPQPLTDAASMASAVLSGALRHA